MARVRSPARSAHEYHASKIRLLTTYAPGLAVSRASTCLVDPINSTRSSKPRKYQELSSRNRLKFAALNLENAMSPVRAVSNLGNTNCSPVRAVVNLEKTASMTRQYQHTRKARSTRSIKPQKYFVSVAQYFAVVHLENTKYRLAQ